MTSTNAERRDRTYTPRVVLTARVQPTARALIAVWAGQETGGNMSAMTRVLLAEAVAARQARAGAR